MPRAHHRSSAAAERPARGAQAGSAARYIGALALLAVGIAHIEQYYVDSYRAIPVIEPCRRLSPDERSEGTRPQKLMSCSAARKRVKSPASATSPTTVNVSMPRMHRKRPITAPSGPSAASSAIRRLMTHPEPRDRRVIRGLVGRDHPERNVVKAVTLDAPRRPNAGRIGVDEQRDHHRRIMRRPPPTVLAIRRIERI
jgi:hypothetical protein